MITKKEFDKYEQIRLSGITNMFDLSRVIAESNNILTKDKCIKIQKNFEELGKKYNDL